MATSAFKSTTKRAPIGKSSNPIEDLSSSNRNSAHRRSRSLSRFSHRLPGAAPEEDFCDDVPVRRGKFVNTVRGSGVPEISLDDLAIELFNSSSDRGRAFSRSDGVSPGAGGGASQQRRGRSATRQSSRVGGGDGRRASLYSGSGGEKVVAENNSRRRRSVSVVRYQISDSESDLDHSQNSSIHVNPKSYNSGNNQMTLSHKPTVANHRQGLRRSISQKDLRFHDGYSSQSSALTDDEGRDAYSAKNGNEKTIRAVYAQKKAEHPTGDDVNSGLYEAMRKELRHAVEEIRMELEQGMVKTDNSAIACGNAVQSKSLDIQAVSTIRKNYATKLEQSQKWKQDLLAEIVLEQQRGRELSKIVKELLPDSKNTVVEKPSRIRKRSNDRSRMSKRLTEEAEKYIEDFISNVEDTTDISSVDGERSDTSSSLGGITKTSPVMPKSTPVEMDGVLLPWLQWETTNDASLSCKNKTDQKVPKNVWKEANMSEDLCNLSTSSWSSWSPGGEPGSCKSKYHSSEMRRSQFDADEYLQLKGNEDFLSERWRQQQRINTGGLLLCNHLFI